MNFAVVKIPFCRSQWPSGPRRGPAADSLLGLRVQNPSATLMSVSCESCVLLGRGLCDEPIFRPEQAYRLWCVSMNVIKKASTWGGQSPRGLCSYDRNNSCCELYSPENFPLLWKKKCAVFLDALNSKRLTLYGKTLFVLMLMGQWFSHCQISSF